MHRSCSTTVCLFQIRREYPRNNNHLSSWRQCVLQRVECKMRICSKSWHVFKALKKVTAEQCRFIEMKRKPMPLRKQNEMWGKSVKMICGRFVELRIFLNVFAIYLSMSIHIVIASRTFQKNDNVYNIIILEIRLN